MLMNSKVWVFTATVIALSAFLASCGPADDARPIEIPGAGERVIMDELSLWMNPANSGISYDQFEPVRVRDHGAHYFQRTNKTFAGSGTRYGEIRLSDAAGEVMYLPRLVAVDKDDALKLMVRTNSTAGQWQISVYPAADKVARVNAQTSGITVTPSGAWSNVTIPFAALKYQPFKLEYKEKKTWRDPNHLLAQYEAPQGDLYAIGFAMPGGKAGESLFIDRIVLAKTTHTKDDVISGVLKPAIANADIFLRSDKGDTRVNVQSNGSFEVAVPQGAKILEVVAEADGKVMSPRSGRFLEVGSYMPKIVIPTKDGIIKKSLQDGDANDGLYIYEEKYGPRIEPNQHFLSQVTTNGDLVTQSELTTNAFGYLDRDREAANPDKTYRVMLLGECHHEGLHIAEPDVWWNEAEALALMKAKRPIEFISASFNHASFTSSWPAYRDLGADLKPDIVLLPIIDPGVLNLTVEEYMMDWLGAAKDHRPAYQFELDANGKLVHKPNDPDWQLYRTPFPEADHQRVREQYVTSPYIHANPAETPQWVKDNMKLSIASLQEFAKLAKERKTRFAILYISSYGETNTKPYVENGQNFDPNLFRGEMRDMAKAAGLEFIDVSHGLHMSMDGKDKTRMVFANNGHFTPYAHYRYGQVLGDLVSSWVNQ